MGRKKREPCEDCCVPECPVLVSWNKAQLFVAKLNQLTGHGKIYRLPTEAEWECACRAGRKSHLQSNELNHLAWYEANSFGSPHKVAQRNANPWGLYDMLGNVWEWCQDRYQPDYYSPHPHKDPRAHLRARAGSSGVDPTESLVIQFVVPIEILPIPLLMD